MANPEVVKINVVDKVRIKVGTDLTGGHLRTYQSVTAMNDDVANVPNGQFALINTGNVNDEDDAKLFVKAGNAFSFVTDFLTKLDASQTYATITDMNTKANQTSLDDLKEIVNANTQAISTKQPSGNYLTTTDASSTYLKKAGDTVTGELNVPTQVATDNSTKVASTAFVQTAVANLVSSAPATLNTLNKLAAALGDDPTAHPDKLVNLTTNGNSLRAVKGDGTNVDVVVPYAVGMTQANPKVLGNYITNKISDIRDLFNNELADMNTKGCSVRFIRLGADLTTMYNNWAKDWDATMSPWGTIYGVMSLLGDDTYANVELVGFTGTTVLLQRIGGVWQPAKTKVYSDALNNNLASHNADTTAHIDIRNIIPQISILTGTCMDGQTIPLPDGYTESQCKIFVSMATQNPNNYWFDPTEYDARNMLRVECYTEGRILRCAMIADGYDCWRTGSNSGSFIDKSWMSCRANYIVIGIKYRG